MSGLSVMCRSKWSDELKWCGVLLATARIVTARLTDRPKAVPFDMAQAIDVPASVETLIVDRLAETDLPASIADLVLAALLGDDDFDAALGPRNWQRPSVRAHTPPGTVPRFSCAPLPSGDSAVSGRRPCFTCSQDLG